MLYGYGPNETAGRRIAPSPLRGISDRADGTLRGSSAQMFIYLFILAGVKPPEPVPGLLLPNFTPPNEIFEIRAIMMHLLERRVVLRGTRERGTSCGEQSAAEEKSIRIDAGYRLTVLSERSYRPRGQVVGSGARLNGTPK
jgi:hypothetical protein